MADGQQANELQLKRREVLSWLSYLFEGEELKFSVTEDSIDYLWNLMKKNQEMDRITTICIKSMEQEIEEYEAEAARLQQVLADTGLTLESFSQSGKGSLNVLTNVASTLGLKNTSKASYGHAIVELTTRSETLKRQQEKEHQTALELERKTKKTLERCTTLRKLQENIDQQSTVQVPVAEKQMKQIRFLEEKSKGYKAKIQSLLDELIQSGLREDLYHESILELQEILLKLQKEMRPLQADLNAFHSLPPDIPLAKVKVEMARRELEQLTSKLCSDIDSLRL